MKDTVTITKAEWALLQSSLREERIWWVMLAQSEVRMAHAPSGTVLAHHYANCEIRHVLVSRFGQNLDTLTDVANGAGHS